MWQVALGVRNLRKVNEIKNHPLTAKREKKP
jgi:hypothetical protein